MDVAQRRTLAGVAAARVRREKVPTRRTLHWGPGCRAHGTHRRMGRAGYFALKSRAAVTARHKRSSKRSGKSLSRARSRTTVLFAEYPRERPNKSTPSDVAGCLLFREHIKDKTKIRFPTISLFVE